MTKRIDHRNGTRIEIPPPSRKHPPVHPGSVLRADFMEPLGMSAARLAHGIGISAMHVGRILKGSHGVSAETALRLARFLGTSAEVWVELQARFDLDAVTKTHGRQIDRTIKPYKANHVTQGASVKKGD
jgi:addiction module HigA family antidote